MYQGFADVGNGVALPDYDNPFKTQVEGEVQSYVAYANLHASLFGSYRRHLVHCPFLHRWHVEQCCEYRYQ